MSLRQPVQYPVKYYSHLDAGAPQLSDADGVIKTILKSCLVTGYGTKAGAGWTALFEDDFRIVLRRPLRTGNPPDIKIENGVINGTASHRIVSQDNPTGLNDANELAVVNLLARDSKHGAEWHLIVSDFGFLLCYQMGEYGRSGVDRNNLLYVGATMKLRSSDSEFFVASYQQAIGINGRSAFWMRGLLHTTDVALQNMSTGVKYTSIKYINIDVAEKYYDDDYTAQNLILDKVAMLPFLCSVSPTYLDKVTKTVVIDQRNMLRYVNKPEQANSGDRALYIPLDYWEL